MAIYSMKGAKISIGLAVAMKSGAWVAGDFTTPLTTKTEIKEPETLAAAGEEFAELAFENVTDGTVRVLKGARKGGLLEFTHGHDYADAGQIAVKAAFEAETDYAFEVEWADKPTAGASPKNSRRMFVGKVMKLSDGGEGTGVGKLTYSVQLNSNIVRVNASAT
ncbi:MAG: hypothetical protein MUE52_01705 [Tabrizicola sp.]|jgi:hypothetical protein|nr:hypothetical protein [Tabrizicola sp.]